MFLDGLYLFLNWVKDSVAGAIYRKRAQDAAEVKAIVDEIGRASCRERVSSPV